MYGYKWVQTYVLRVFTERHNTRSQYRKMVNRLLGHNKENIAVSWRHRVQVNTINATGIKYQLSYTIRSILTHWGRETYICVGKLAIIGSDNGLSPERRQAIIWTNAGILLIGPFGTNFSEILIEIRTFSFKKMHLKMSSAKCCSFRLGLNVFISYSLVKRHHRHARTSRCKLKVN